MMDDTINLGRCTIDQFNVMHHPKGHTKFSPMEVRYIRLLGTHANQVVHRETLMRALYTDETEMKTIDVNIHRIRSKFLKDRVPLTIVTSYTVGYALMVDQDEIHYIVFDKKQWIDLHRALRIAEEAEPGIIERTGIT